MKRKPKLKNFIFLHLYDGHEGIAILKGLVLSAQQIPRKRSGCRTRIELAMPAFADCKSITVTETVEEIDLLLSE